MVQKGIKNGEGVRRVSGQGEEARVQPGLECGIAII